jgi:hypothetical protein
MTRLRACSWLDGPGNVPSAIRVYPNRCSKGPASARQLQQGLSTDCGLAHLQLVTAVTHTQHVASFFSSSPLGSCSDACPVQKMDRRQTMAWRAGQRADTRVLPKHCLLKDGTRHVRIGREGLEFRGTRLNMSPRRRISTTLLRRDHPTNGVTRYVPLCECTRFHQRRFWLMLQ